MIKENDKDTRRLTWMNSGFAFFMHNDCEDDLSMLYRLLRKVNALDLCVKHFREYVKVNGMHDTIRPILKQR